MTYIKKLKFVLNQKQELGSPAVFVPSTNTNMTGDPRVALKQIFQCGS